jgi:16S rRNA C1402 (ribose-2'-O) methylase RsmI
MRGHPAYLILVISINLAVDQRFRYPIRATAAIAALSISGLPTDSFVFEGFLLPNTGPSQTPSGTLHRKNALSSSTKLRTRSSRPSVVRSLRRPPSGHDPRLTKIRETIRGTLDIVKALHTGTSKREFTIIAHGAQQNRRNDIDTASISKPDHTPRPEQEGSFSAAAEKLGIPKKNVYESLKI